MRLLQARRERDEVEFALALDRVRRTAEADRDVGLTRATVEEQKSNPVGDHELAKFVAKKATQAMGSRQIREGTRIRIGDASPVTWFAKMLVGMRELIAQHDDSSPQTGDVGTSPS